MAKLRKSDKKAVDKNNLRPYLAAAVFCEKVLLEPNNVHSAIRIVDTVTLVGDSPPKPGEMVDVQIQMLVAFKTGEARGPRHFSLRLITPSGKSEDAGTWSFDFTDPPEGGNVIRTPKVPLTWEQEGLYWYEIALERELVTRMPLVVKFSTSPAPSEMTGS